MSWIGNSRRSKKLEENESLQCPECESNNVALIFWGYPGDEDWYIDAIKRKEIVPGGCIIGDNDPKWTCNECSLRWGERDDD